MYKINLWNEKDLAVPPINTYKALSTSIDVKHLYNVCYEGQIFFDREMSTQKHACTRYMHAEYAALSRIVYRMKQKFRSAKDFKALEKVHKTMENYFAMDITSTLKTFVDLIPSRHKEEIYLPTKDLLDYILVRLQGIGKLMERLVESSKIAAYLLDKRMHTGHFWKIAFIMFSLISRVCILAKFTGKFVCDFYRKLLPFSSQLKNTGSGWLPPSYILPQDLGKWMDVDWLEFDEEVQIVEVPTEIPDIMKFFDLGDDDDDVQFCEEYLMIEDDEDDEAEIHFNEANDYKAKIPFTQRLSQLRGFDNSEDIGEVIDIEDSLLISDNKYSANSKNIKKRYFESTSENTEKVEVTEDVKEDKSVIEIAADYNVDPVDSAQERAKAEENVTIPDTSIMEITGDYKTCDKAHSISEQKIKNRLNIVTDETLLVPNSESDNSSDDNDEENILTVSDVSLIEVPDDDSMTVVTSTPKNRNNGSIGRERKNLNVTLKHSKINEDENVIIIPDTPGVETNMKREKTRAKKKATNSDTLIKLSDDEDKSVILVNEEEEPENDNGHITLDDPIKRTQSDIKKEKIKLRNLVKKLNKLKRHKHTAQNPNTLIKTNKLKKLASKISEPLKLNSNDTIMVSEGDLSGISSKVKKTKKIKARGHLVDKSKKGSKRSPENDSLKIHKQQKKSKYKKDKRVSFKEMETAGTSVLSNRKSGLPTKSKKFKKKNNRNKKVSESLSNISPNNPRKRKRNTETFGAANYDVNTSLGAKQNLNKKKKQKSKNKLPNNEASSTVFDPSTSRKIRPTSNHPKKRKRELKRLKTFAPNELRHANFAPNLPFKNKNGHNTFGGRRNSEKFSRGKKKKGK